VIAASAGNHALGLSWHGRLLGVAVTVVMPRFAPLVKVARCRQYGATVVLHGETVIENAELPGLVERGPVGLQHHGSLNKEGKWTSPPALVQFRNISIKELK